jgi:hypothetical protein
MNGRTTPDRPFEIIGIEAQPRGGAKLHFSDGARLVTVLVAATRTSPSVVFPHPDDSDGASLGDPMADEQLRRKARAFVAFATLGPKLQAALK